MTESSPTAATSETRFSWERLRTNRNWLGFLFMIPAAGFLIVFLAYPLGLGVWMSFTDTRHGYKDRARRPVDRARELHLALG